MSGAPAVRIPLGASPWARELARLVNAELLRLEPRIIGHRHDGTNLHIRYLAPLGAPWVQEHIQTTQAGEGGGTYDTTDFNSSTEVDCRADRLQDITLSALPGETYFLWLVPIHKDGAGNTILYDGEGGRSDFAAFLGLEG